jgi:hypothetical protein
MGRSGLSRAQCVTERVIVAMLVESRLVIRLVEIGTRAGYGLLVRGEIAGPVTPGSVVVAAAVGNGGEVLAEARCAVNGCADDDFTGLRIELGPVGGHAGAKGDQRVTVVLRLAGGQNSMEELLYSGDLVVEETTRGGFLVRSGDFLRATTLGFDAAGEPGAPVLTIRFWCPTREGDDELLAALYYDGRVIVTCGRGDDGEYARLNCAGGGIELRRDDTDITEIDVAPDARNGFQRYVARVPGARAFVVGSRPEASSARAEPRPHDLSAHPGVYALRVTRGADLVARVPFEIEWTGVVREAGRIESRSNGTRVMLIEPRRPGGAHSVAPSGVISERSPVAALSQSAI